MDALSNISNLSVHIIDNTGTDIEITRMFTELNIFESVFEMFLHGEITIQDTLDLISNTPIVGGEDLEIIIETPQASFPIDLKFKIYKVDGDITLLNYMKKNKIYKIYFCSPEQLLNEQINISKKFSDTPDNIVDWLLTNIMNTKKTLFYTNATDSVDCYARFWNSHEIIEYISFFSKSSDYSDYIFFENFDGFYFKPISELMNSAPIQTLSYTLGDSDLPVFMSTTNINNYQFVTYVDILNLLRDGVFGSTLWKFSDGKYAFDKTEKSFLETQEKFISLGGKSILPDAYSDPTNFIGVSYLDHEVSTIRQTQLRLMQEYNMVCKMNGDFTRKAGTLVEMHFPNLDNINMINNQFDGKWFVNTIRHIINTNTRYEQNILFSKNASFNSPYLTSISALTNK